MALIRNLEPGTGKSTHPRSEVDGTYILYEDSERGRILKITTYGSDSRQSQAKPSQVVEIDSKIAKQLLRILNENFGSE